TSVIDSSAGAVAGTPPAPTIGLDHASATMATLRGAGAVASSDTRVRVFVDGAQRGGDLLIANDGSDGGAFHVDVPVGVGPNMLVAGPHTATAIQIVNGLSSVASDPASFVIGNLPPPPVVLGSPEVVSGNGHVTISGMGKPGATITSNVGQPPQVTTV